MEKVKGKLHYSSSPDRGLDNILYLLPWIQEKVDYKIHIDVYYGFNNLEQANPTLAKRLHELIKVSGEDSVHFKGRVSQIELAQAWKKAYVWFYPTAFWETYCITAKEAQLSSTPIVCSNEGALQTTVGNAGIRVDGHPYSRESRVRYVNEMVKILTDEEYWMHWSLQSLKGSENCSWRHVYNEYWGKLL